MSVDVTCCKGAPARPCAKLIGRTTGVAEGRRARARQGEVEGSSYHGANAVSTAGVQLLTTQRDMIYTAHAETRVRNLGRNKTALGLTVSRLVEDGGPPVKARRRVCCLPSAVCCLAVQAYEARFQATAWPGLPLTCAGAAARRCRTTRAAAAPRPTLLPARACGAACRRPSGAPRAQARGAARQGPVALGVKVEDRLKVRKNAKLVAAVGGMTTKTRGGRENATAGNAELKMRLGADERTQARAPRPPLPLRLQPCTHGCTPRARAGRARGVFDCPRGPAIARLGLPSAAPPVQCRPARPRQRPGPGLDARPPGAQVVAGGSFMNFRNDLALGGNLATQFTATPETQVGAPAAPPCCTVVRRGRRRGLSGARRARAGRSRASAARLWRALQGRQACAQLVPRDQARAAEPGGRGRAGGLAAEPELQGPGVGDAARDLARPRRAGLVAAGAGAGRAVGQAARRGRRLLGARRARGAGACARGAAAACQRAGLALRGLRAGRPAGCSWEGRACAAVAWHWLERVLEAVLEDRFAARLTGQCAPSFV